MNPMELIESSPIAAVVSDPRLPDNPIIECNAAFTALTGYSRDEIIGRNCRFLTGEATEPAQTELLRTSIRTLQPVITEIVNYRKNGNPFRNAIMIAPIFNADGNLEYFLGSQMEVADGVTKADEDRRKNAIAKVELLSRRQRQIMVNMAAGRLNKQIAFDLNLSERTVKMHRSAVFKALGIKTSADAIRIAIEAGY
jgi:PAS domain S-box-containing protein